MFGVVSEQLIFMYLFIYFVIRSFVMSSKTERNFSISLNLLISKMNKKIFLF